MAINQKDIKLLWGRSGNRCAMCHCELTQDKVAVSASYTLGEQAHIVGEKEKAARGISVLTLDERNSYHNLILLCPTHHTEIDENEEDWPVEKLHQKKSEHELWVNETLSETKDNVNNAKQIAVTSVIDNAVTLCCLEEWMNWTSFALSPDPRWDKDMPNNIYKFRQKVIAAIWPSEFKELERATITFSVLINSAVQVFMKHSDLKGDTYYPVKFYKNLSHNPNYDRDLEAYEKWQEECYEAIRIATKAANWFADTVRKDINPMFFAEKGKYLIMEGPFADLSVKTSLVEFADEEKEKYPDELYRV